MQRDEPAGAAWEEIRVDLAALQHLTDGLSTEVSYNVRPTVLGVFDQFARGAHFGIKNPSVDLHAVKQKYDDCLNATVDRLAKHLAESKRLLDAADVILRQYKSTDALAAASLDDLRRAFESSVNKQRGD
jgi:hypothetical protein